MRTFAGVDAGGSHTEAVVGESFSDILARHTGGPASVRPDNVEGAATVIVDTLQSALQASGRERVTALAVGAAGAGREPEQAALTAALRSRLGPDVPIAAVTDADIALEDAFPDGAPGIVVIAGTGSIAIARDADGTFRRSGGLGPDLGDEGSGYAIARTALRAAGRAADHRGPPTQLHSQVQRYTGTQTLDELIRWTQRADRESVASLARAVCDAADQGDPVANQVVSAAGADLATLAAALANRFEPGVQIALAGSLLAAGSPVRAATVGEIAVRIPGARVSDQLVDGARGALRIATRLVE